MVMGVSQPPRQVHGHDMSFEPLILQCCPSGGGGSGGDREAAVEMLRVCRGEQRLRGLLRPGHGDHLPC